MPRIQGIAAPTLPQDSTRNGLRPKLSPNAPPPGYLIPPAGAMGLPPAPDQFGFFRRDLRACKASARGAGPAWQGARRHCFPDGVAAAPPAVVSAGGERSSGLRHPSHLGPLVGALADQD